MTDKKPGRKPRVSDSEVLDVLRESDDPVLMAGEVAEQLPIKRRATHDRLRALHNQGEIERKDIGPHAVYWINREG